jgi:hypothetical protein
VVDDDTEKLLGKYCEPCANEVLVRYNARRKVNG